MAAFARRWFAIAVLLVLVAAGCGADEPSAPAPAVTGAVATETVELDGRPFVLGVPTSYAPGQPTPLVVLLHGYTSSAAEQESYFQLGAEAERRGFLYALPDGTTNSEGNQFWNATNACCDFERSGVDDSAYLSKLIDRVSASYTVDSTRVYLVGHSNGGYMAYRMACDHADQISAIVSLAGATWLDPDRCAPVRPVTILQIHGTADTVVDFYGSSIYPAAAETVSQWRESNGCSSTATEREPLDLDTGLTGAETTVTRYADGCRHGTRVELWTIEGGSHVPALSPGFATSVVDFLLTAQATASPVR